MANKISAEHKSELYTLLKSIRKEAGLSQLELANKLGMPQSFVSKYESGERRLDILEIKVICKALNLPLQTFIKRLENNLK